MSARHFHCLLQFFYGFCVFVGGGKYFGGTDSKVQLLLVGQIQCSQTLKSRFEICVAG